MSSLATSARSSGSRSANPAALTEHGELIASEVLADEFRPGAAGDLPGAHQHPNPDLDLTFWLTRAG